MACLLHIETSAETCSVALSRDGQCVFERVSPQQMNHAASVSGYIQEALAEAKALGEKVQAVAVSAGPGSYTGLRIGFSTAKGLCYGMGVPLIAIPTLEILAAALRKTTEGLANTDALLCPMTDARRMEVYTALFNPQLEEVQATQAVCLDREGTTFLPADISGLSCAEGEVDNSVFDRYLVPLYKEASYKPYIIAAMIMMSKVKDPVAALMALDQGGKRKIF